MTLNSSMGYDSQGRPSTHTYPDGLTVQTLYGPYGQTGAIANYTTGKIWYETTAEDAWGKPTTEKYTDGTVGTIVDYQSSGQENTASWSLNGTVVDALAYGYDSFGNLVKQQRTAGSSINTETYGYDQLQRLQNTGRTGGSVIYGYSASGNLLSKGDFGTSYSYAAPNGLSNGCGPHAVNAAGGYTYKCDANGNVYGGSTLTIAYDADNHPRTASRTSAGSVIWAYDANGGMDYESSSRGVRYFAPGGYEQVGSQYIHELGPIVVTNNGGNVIVTTTLRGRLGSTIDTIDAGFPTAANARTYDAFGGVRDGTMKPTANGTLNLNDTIHGFTKHEHADDVWLIHMGGRIYDYNLGRFLNVDPIVGNPLSSQSLNPYSYIGNNPLSGTDPTGYESKSNSQHCDAPGSGDPGCGMSTANKIDGFKSASSVVNLSTGETMGSSGAVSSNAQGAGGNTPSQQTAGTPTGSTPATQPGQPAPNDDTQTPATLGTITVTPNSPGGWSPSDKVSWSQYYAETAQFKQDVIDSITSRDEDFILGMLLGPLKSPLDLGRGLYSGDSNRTAWGAVGVAAMVVPDAGEAVAALETTMTVRTYTNAVGREGITSSGVLDANRTWVTLPGEIPSQAGHLQIEKMLEIQPGRGSYFLDFQTPASNLRIPENGPLTSGHKLQWRLNEDVPIDPSTFRRPPGRPGE